jgi:hypothetical protein
MSILKRKFENSVSIKYDLKNDNSYRSFNLTDISNYILNALLFCVLLLFHITANTTVFYALVSKH